MVAFIESSMTGKEAALRRGLAAKGSRLGVQDFKSEICKREMTYLVLNIIYSLTTFLLHECVLYVSISQEMS